MRGDSQGDESSARSLQGVDAAGWQTGKWSRASPMRKHGQNVFGKGAGRIFSELPEWGG